MAELKSTKELRERKKEQYRHTNICIHTQDKEKVWIKLCNMYQSVPEDWLMTWKGRTEGRTYYYTISNNREYDDQSKLHRSSQLNSKLYT